MYSKQRYKICICLAILGELEAFRNYKGFSVIFPKILDAVERFTKVRKKICICLVILGELGAFRNYKGFSVIFPKILDAVERFTKVRIFLVLLSISFLNPKILGFLFLRKLA